MGTLATFMAKTTKKETQNDSYEIFFFFCFRDSFGVARTTRLLAPSQSRPISAVEGCDAGFGFKVTASVSRQFSLQNLNDPIYTPK